MRLIEGVAEPETPSLIKRRGGRARLEELYRQSAPGAGRLAYLILGDRHRAEDIVHDAFVRLAGRLQTVRDPDSFEHYLRRTVVNLCNSYLRRLRLERTRAQREASLQQTVEPAPANAEEDAIWAALEKLPVRQRTVVVLRYYEDLSEQQTADVMGCSLSAVKSLANRAMAHLRAELRKDTS